MTAVTTDEARTIPRDAVAAATVSNSREFVDASIAKVWNEADSSIVNVKSLVPSELKVTLNRNNQAYKEVTLNVGNSWTADVSQLPKVDDSGADYVYAWVEPSVDGWTPGSKTYTNNGQAVTEAVTNEAGLLTTITNTVDVGSLKVNKHFAGFDRAALSAEELNDIVFAVADADGKTVRTNTLANFAVAAGDADPSWTVEGLPVGTYTVTETNNLKKYSFATTYAVGEGAATTKPASAPVAKGQIAQVNVTNTYIPEKPGFSKKIKDTNDSTGKTSDWQDSADYDIGDAVPYRLVATLPTDVTAYKKYHITFTDKMEESLDYNKDAQVVVYDKAGKPIDSSSYKVERAENAHDFAITLRWAGEEGAVIANEALNGATVEVLFTATLNESAKLGNQGNVNTCKLAYSNNPASKDDKDEGELPWDYVIAFTYQVDVSKVDPKSKPLAGAEFKLEKLVKGAEGAEDAYVEVTRITNAGGENKNVFTATGLDDGTYRLTETKVPAGYAAISPITFVVTAEHNAVWDYTSDAAAEPVFGPSGRTTILSSLTGSEETGVLKLAASEALAGLAGNLANAPSGTPASLVVKKTVSSSRSQDKSREYAFKVTLDDKTITGTYGDMEFTNGSATFKLKHGESKKATGLPLNEKGVLGYQIAEIDAGGLVSTMGKPVKSKDGLTHTVTCTNTYTPTTPTSKTTTSGASRIATAQTGDASSLWAVAALVAAGGASTVVGVLRRRRRG